MMLGSCLRALVPVLATVHPPLYLAKAPGKTEVNSPITGVPATYMEYEVGVPDFGVFQT